MSVFSNNSKPFTVRSLFRAVHFNPSLVLFLVIFSALVAFEMFNYSTTDHALSDLLGGLEFAGLRWSTILAFAFCGIDFAGIARIFTPEQGLDEPKEIWYLFGAWLLAATMNALLTWWGVSMAIAMHQVQSTAILDANLVTKGVPVFVALMVWVIRILIIGTLSMAGDRLLWGRRTRSAAFPPGSNRIGQGSGSQNRPLPTPRPVSSPSLVTRNLLNRAEATGRPPLTRTAEPTPAVGGLGAALRSEPTYHSLNGAGQRPMVRPPAAQVDTGEVDIRRRL